MFPHQDISVTGLKFSVCPGNIPPQHSFPLATSPGHRRQQISLMLCRGHFPWQKEEKKRVGGKRRKPGTSQNHVCFTELGQKSCHCKQKVTSHPEENGASPFQGKALHGLVACEMPWGWALHNASDPRFEPCCTTPAISTGRETHQIPNESLL